MGGVVLFNAEAFKLRYSEFNNISDELLQAYFDESTLILNNTIASPVSDLGQRKVLLWLLTAHHAALNDADGMVGRLSSASQGPVSVSLAWESSKDSQWYDQTPYGAQYWINTAPFRTMQYRPGASRPARSYTRGYY
ncbi:DUF4054 domain-containing protein [Acinetobacter nectaris]|uniref:DUF4054 domain-containing protein n=1 Tax=Acinetobacter nectaris TaxID=1219382 RepID=UPI001F41BB72|nr:DUF4054 domain-containing protein [Acinetobacter nectaris]MCF9034205.1 DUF4054 domain-containing protein [Acinetobacter nectaris]